MADSILDFAGLDAAATNVESTNNSNSDVNNSIEVNDSDIQNTDNANETTNGDADGAVKSGEEKLEKNPDGTPKESINEKSPVPEKIRQQLKAWRDSVDPATPEGKAAISAVKALHGSYERWEAAKEVFPKGIAEMREAANIVKELGGAEGYAQSQLVLESVKATDQKIYDGDASVLDEIIEDLKSENKIGSFSKIIGPGLDKLKSVDSDGYYKAIAPHFLAGLQESRVPQVLQGLSEALAAGDVMQAKKTLGNMISWYNNLHSTQEKNKSAELDPERQKFAEEKKAFETSKRTEFNNEVAKIAESSDNSALGSALKDYVKLPFFKGFTNAAWKDLAAGVKQELRASLKADKAYQTQMTAMWNQKTPAIEVFCDREDSRSKYNRTERVGRRLPRRGQSALQEYGADRTNALCL